MISDSKAIQGTNHVMKCSACDLKLGVLFESNNIRKTQTLDEIYRELNNVDYDRPVKYQIICKCGGESFVVISKNNCYFVPESNMSMTNMNWDCSGDIIRSTTWLQ